MYLYVGVCVCVYSAIEARAAISPGTGVTNDGEPPDILGTELRPSARTTCIFTYSTILQLQPFLEPINLTFSASGE